MHGLFAYMNLATVVMMAVSKAAVVFSTRPVNGQDVASVAQGVIDGVKIIRPKTNIPPALVIKCAEVVAETVNDYFSSHPVATKPVG